MKLTRKDFIKTSSIITAGLLLPIKSFSRFLSEDDNFKKIRDNIGIYTERGGTIGWYVSNDAVVVVDSQYPETARNFMEGLKKKTTRKIDLLFNTHHHGDHTAGNIYLKDYTDKIVAHEKCLELQKKFYGNDPNKPQVYPDTTFKDEWTVILGKEKVTAKYFGTAHTGGDSVIYFEKANFAHVGDLVFNKTYPFIDLSGGASLEGWIDVLEKIAVHYLKDTVYIFGHGITNDLVTGNSDNLYAMRSYISALFDFVSKEIKSGKTSEEINKTTSIRGFENLKERWTGALKMNIEKTYEYLTKK